MPNFVCNIKKMRWLFPVDILMAAGSLDYHPRGIPYRIRCRNAPLRATSVLLCTPPRPAADQMFDIVVYSQSDTFQFLLKEPLIYLHTFSENNLEHFLVSVGEKSTSNLDDLFYTQPLTLS